MKINSLLFGFLFLLTLSTTLGCGANLFGGLSKPSSDPQILSAARAALDQGNYQQASDLYQQLSSNSNDFKVSELGLTQLAQGSLFSYSDLIVALGTGGGTGDANTLVNLINVLAQRNLATTGSRGSLLTIYRNQASIADPVLKGWMQFIVATTMFNDLLAAAAKNSSFVAADLVANPTVCKTANCADAGAGTAACTKPAGGSFYDNASGDGSSGSDAAISMDTSPLSEWETSASMNKVIGLTSVLPAQFASFAGPNVAGYLAILKKLEGIPSADACGRQFILDILYP